MVKVSELDFAPEAEELARLRGHVRHTLDEWGLAPLTQVACLLVTELATNAIAHTASPAELRLVHDDMLRLAVTDTDPAPPRPHEPGGQTRAGGRGLNLVAALADSWDYAYTSDGAKTVWCELLPVSAPGLSEDTEALTPR